MLFQSSTNGIDICDGRVGDLLTRISLPFTLSQNFDALVSDGTDNVLVAITGETGNGIAVIDLTSLSEPPPLSYREASSRVDSALSHIPTPTSIGRHVPITVAQHRVGPPLVGKR